MVTDEPKARRRPPLDGDFRSYATYRIALVALVLVTPFTLYNYVEHRYGIAIASTLVVLILVLNAWSSRGGRHGPRLTLLTLVPALVLFLALSLRLQGTIGLLWCYPSVLVLYCMLPERWAWWTNAALLAVVLPALALSLETDIALRGAVTLLGVSLFSAILVRVITDQQDALRAQVVTDPLTGLLNRRALAPTLERAIGQHLQQGTPMTLLVVDLDHFKRINDEHGHEAGDVALRALGAILRSRTRAGDSVFRLGGEEFLLLLYGAAADDAARLAESLRRQIRDGVLLEGRTVTASIGLATLEPAETMEEWLRRADSALYRAKAGGRDRVVGESLPV